MRCWLLSRSARVWLFALSLGLCGGSASAAPDVSGDVITARDGSIIRFADLRGHWLLVNYTNPRNF